RRKGLCLDDAGTVNMRMGRIGQDEFQVPVQRHGQAVGEGAQGRDDKGKRTQIVRADAIRSGKLRVGGGPTREIVLVENAAGNVSTAIADEAARGVERLPIVKTVKREGVVPL